MLDKIIKEYNQRRPEVKKALAILAGGNGELSLAGLTDGGKAFVLGLARAVGMERLLVVCSDIDSALSLLGEAAVYSLAETRLIPPQHQAR